MRKAEQLPLGPLLALLPAGSWNPDVLNAPPLGARTDFADELAQVAAVAADTFAAEVARCRLAQGHPVPQASPTAQREEAVGLLELAWRELLLPQRPRLHDVLAADVAVRGTGLAAGGLAAVLADLHPQVRLIGSSVLIGIGHAAKCPWAAEASPSCRPHRAGGGLGAMWDPPWQPALAYPARGTRPTATTPAPGGLGRLFGRTRAAVLAALTDPATTSGLADRCRVPLAPPATTSRPCAPHA